MSKGPVGVFDSGLGGLTVVKALKESLPNESILYFGDTNKYLKSKLKVITVGKNPSNVEFRLIMSEKYSYIRFPEYNNDVKSLAITLNNYFKNKPYNKWGNNAYNFL